MSASKPFLYKPLNAIRIRANTNDPTPWPPETPAGENPMAGAGIDYYLPADASAPVLLEILDPSGRVVRHITSADTGRNPHPALDPAGYNKVCQQNPGAADCGVPLYWPAPPVTLSAKAGAHRYWWDLHYDPIGEYGAFGIGGGATPRRQFPGINSPWAAPGNYTVRLTVDGTTLTQPIVLRLDPRVKLPPVTATTLTTLTRDLYRSAQDAHAAYEKARALSATLAVYQQPDAVTLKARIDSLAPVAVAGGGRGGRGFGGRGGAGNTAPANLSTITGTLVNAISAMQTADMAPTATRLDAARKAQADAATVMQRWNTLRGPMLTALNAKLRAAGQPIVQPPK
jgi:hypothetical protein